MIVLMATIATIATMPQLVPALLFVPFHALTLHFPKDAVDWICFLLCSINNETRYSVQILLGLFLFYWTSQRTPERREKTFGHPWSRTWACCLASKLAIHYTITLLWHYAITPLPLWPIKNQLRAYHEFSLHACVVEYDSSIETCFQHVPNRFSLLGSWIGLRWRWIQETWDYLVEKKGLDWRSFQDWIYFKQPVHPSHKWCELFIVVVETYWL